MQNGNENLAYQMAGILRISGENDSEIIDAVESLASIHGGDAYNEFFYVLTSKRFNAEAAVLHWKSIVSHVSSVISPSYRHQGLLPTALHYMQRKADIIFDPRLLEADYIENIQRSSITDGLTGLYNQTFFKISLLKIIQQSRRHEVAPFSVVIFDLDHFKHYNDSRGHLAGDQVLKRVAEIILQNIRESDVAVRYGGEEFALLLPQATRIYATVVAQRIRQAIEAERFFGQEQLPSGNLTISGGVAEFPHDAEDTDALIEFADAELYKAKARRNCIYPIGKDRRSSFRHPVRSLVEFSPDQERRIRPGLSFDVSESGMAMGCDKLLLVGSPVDVLLNRPFWKNACLLNGTVRQVRKLGDLFLLELNLSRGCLNLMYVLNLSWITNIREKPPIYPELLLNSH